MSKERELLERVLYTFSGDALDILRCDIRELLSQPEQESFFHYECAETANVFDVFKTASYERIMTIQGKHNLNLLLQMLDSSPTLGLQMLDTNLWSALRITELLAQIEQTEQEPVAWMCNLMGDVVTYRPNVNNGYTPLYTSPQKREPLSDDEIRKERSFIEIEMKI